MTKNDKKYQKNNKNEPNVIELGERTLNKQHKNRTIVIPKVALKNCGCNGNGKMLADVKFVQDTNGEKFIKVTPTNCEDEA